MRPKFKDLMNCKFTPEVEITDRLEKIAYDTDGYKFTDLD